MSEKEYEIKEFNDVWTRNQKYGGVGEEHDPDTVEVEDSPVGQFKGFEADEEINVEQLLSQDHEQMEKGEVK